ncbi:MAG TPA: T9SS type A sorting domain-containing protein [Phnomibacter sp.]|nr:T9SS type A sorting domain-containing protein [Phnomibacter sp.]
MSYGNPWEIPAIGYGSITNYQYLLPAGWSLNGTISTGSWMNGSNNATVTSDLASGVNGFIRIRPINSQCGTGLQPGQEVVIPINRPAPTLTITGTQDYICNTGQTASYTMNGMPAGSTIVWQLSNPSVATIVGCSTCPTVTVQKSANFTGFVNLSATVSHCTFSYPVGPREIALGTGRTTLFFSQLTATCEAPSRAYFYGAVEGFTSATNYDWYAKDMTIASNPFVLKQSGLSATADFPLGSKGNRYYTIRVIATTPCGTVSTIDSEGLLWAPSCSGESLMLSVSPNPATDNLAISLVEPTEAKLEPEKQNIQWVEIQDRNGNIVLKQKQGGNSQRANINVSMLRADYYIVRVWTGTQWLSSKLMKQ